MSQPDPQHSKSRLKGLGTAALMALALLLLSFARQAGDVGTGAFHNGMLDNMLDNVLAGGLWGSTLGRNLLLFALALLFIHACFAIACWLLTRLTEYAFPNIRATRTQLVLAWTAGAAIWLLIANAALFPRSSLGSPYAAVVNAGWGPINLFNVVSVLLAAALLTVGITSIVRAATPKQAHGARRLRVVAASCASIAALGMAVAFASHSRPPTHKKPHVIIIGIDSLRYDVATARGGEELAPNVRHFLDGAVTFGNTITPLARTFPSWISILTGRDPHTTGAVVNLLPRSLVDTGDTLGDLYRRAGYRTVYGIDEVRFSNVDGTYGFDQTLTPPIGATDFLLGWFGDTPLSNVVVNTWLGEWLFPHLYANRADAVVYEPDEFVSRVDRNVRFDEPTFLALHLTLAHWPYTWASSDTVPLSLPEVKTAYGKAVRRVDRQFGDLLAVLQRRGALENALVIVLSDHGEGLAQPDDLLIPDGGVLGEIDAGMQSTGHGTSVLSPHQYHVVLAMRSFGKSGVELQPGKVIDAPATLEDLAPTLSDISQLQSTQPFDGMSLMPLLRGLPGAAAPFQNRVRFTETEFNPRGIEVAVATTTSALENAVRYYRVDPQTDRLEVRPEMVNDVLKSRQFAALLGNRLLAAVPRNQETPVYDLVTVSLDGSGARRLTGPPSPDEDPQLAQLWRALQDRLGLDPYELKGDAER